MSKSTIACLGSKVPDAAQSAADSMKAPDLTIIAVNYNTGHLLDEMLSAVARSARGLSVQCIVLDNASHEDPAPAMRDRFPGVHWMRNTVNVGFGRANNQALTRATGRYVLLLNTDAFVAADTLTKTVAFMDVHPRCGVLGVRLIGRDRSLQPSCRYFPTPLNIFLSRYGLSRLFPMVKPVDDMDWAHDSVRECDWIPGCFYLVRRQVIEEVGLFDPRYFLYYEEVDHCRAVKAAGWQVCYFPDTDVVHVGGESAKSDGRLTASGRQLPALQIESELLYLRKHHGFQGVALHMALVTLGTAIRLLKVVVRLRMAKDLRPTLDDCSMTWKLFWRTRWATRTTREPASPA